MKRIASVILAVLSVACMQVFAQNTEDWGAFELEAAISHSQGTFSPGFNGRLSVGYIVAFRESRSISGLGKRQREYFRGCPYCPGFRRTAMLYW